MTDYKIEIIKQIKEVMNDLNETDIKRISLDLDDRYPDETDISINIELNKDSGS